MGGNPYIIGAYVFSVIFSFEGDMSFDGAKIQNAFLHAIERPIFLHWKVKVCFVSCGCGGFIPFMVVWLR